MIHRKVLFILLVIQLINATYTLLTKHALHDKNGRADGYMFSFMRDLIATPLLFMASWLLEGCSGGAYRVAGAATAIKSASTKLIIRRQLTSWRMIFLSICGVAFNQLFYILGLELTSATTASVLTQLNPVVSLIFCSIIGTERMTRQRAFGVFVAALSAVLIVSMPPPQVYHQHQHYHHHHHHEHDNHVQGEDEEVVAARGGSWLMQLAGALLLVLCVVTNTIYYIMQKPFLRHFNPIYLTAITYCYGFVALLVVVVFRSIFITSQSFFDMLSSFSSSTWIAIAFAAVFNSLLKYTLQSKANIIVAVTTSALFGGLVPVLVVFTDCFVLGHAFESRHLYGIGVFIGIYLVVNGGGSSRMNDKSGIEVDVDEEEGDGGGGDGGGGGSGGGGGVAIARLSLRARIRHLLLGHEDDEYFYYDNESSNSDSNVTIVDDGGDVMKFRDKLVRR